MNFKTKRKLKTQTSVSDLPVIFKTGCRFLYLYFAAGATTIFVFADPAGGDRLIAVMHVAETVTCNLAAKLNRNTVKLIKAREPIVWMKIVVVTGKRLLLKIIWMMLLPTVP